MFFSPFVHRSPGQLLGSGSPLGLKLQKFLVTYVSLLPEETKSMSVEILIYVLTFNMFWYMCHHVAIMISAMQVSAAEHWPYGPYTVSSAKCPVEAACLVLVARPGSEVCGVTLKGSLAVVLCEGVLDLISAARGEQNAFPQFSVSLPVSRGLWNFFQEKVSLCSFSCSVTHYVDQAGLELSFPCRQLCASASSSPRCFP